MGVAAAVTTVVEAVSAVATEIGVTSSVIAAADAAAIGEAAATAAYVGAGLGGIQAAATGGNIFEGAGFGFAGGLVGGGLGAGLGPAGAGIAGAAGQTGAATIPGIVGGAAGGLFQAGISGGNLGLGALTGGVGGGIAANVNLGDVFGSSPTDINANNVAATGNATTPSGGVVANTGATSAAPGGAGAAGGGNPAAINAGDTGVIPSNINPSETSAVASTIPGTGADAGNANYGGPTNGQAVSALANPGQANGTPNFGGDARSLASITSDTPPASFNAPDTLSAQQVGGVQGSGIDFGASPTAQTNATYNGATPTASSDTLTPTPDPLSSGGNPLDQPLGAGGDPNALTPVDPTHAPVTSSPLQTQSTLNTGQNINTAQYPSPDLSAGYTPASAPTDVNSIRTGSTANLPGNSPLQNQVLADPRSGSFAAPGGTATTPTQGLVQSLFGSDTAPPAASVFSTGASPGDTTLNQINGNAPGSSPSGEGTGGGGGGGGAGGNKVNNMQQFVNDLGQGNLGAAGGDLFSAATNIPASTLFGGGLLGASALIGNQPVKGQAQLNANAQNILAQGQTNENYLTTGTLPAGEQQLLDQQLQQGIAQVRASYAQMGLSGSTMEQQAIQQVQLQAQQKQQQILTALYQAGAQQVTQGDALLGQVVQQNVAQDNQLSQSIANFASALAGGGSGSLFRSNNPAG